LIPKYKKYNRLKFYTLDCKYVLTFGEAVALRITVDAGYGYPPSVNVTLSIELLRKTQNCNDGIASMGTGGDIGLLLGGDKDMSFISMAISKFPAVDMGSCGIFIAYQYFEPNF
jgi:hypothetical protein